MLQPALTYFLRNTPYFRGKPRLAARLVPTHGERSATIFGLRVPLDLGDFIQRSIYAGTFEPAETRFVKSFLKPGMTFVDVGANVGYYTWLAASLVRESGRVLAFEPAPYAFHRLKTALAWNHVFWTACHNVALSDREGSLTLYVPPESWGNHNASAVSYCEDMTPLTVPSTTLDRTLETAGLQRIDLLKADIEGHELAFLRGAERTARAGGLRAVLCEFNQPYLARANTSPAELEAWFTSHGFECVREFPCHWAGVTNRFFIYRERRAA